jgi:MoxR-like ATPase
MNDMESNAIPDAATMLADLRAAIGQAMVGQSAVVEQVLIALLASGHVLIEGVPGLGKTLLVRALAQALALPHARVQFTPDMMPSDITGHAVLDPSTRELRVVRGPVFTHVLLADEINRAPAKTQSALLEVMQEYQVTLEGQTVLLPKPFMVLATQNPVETEGTYPLPEAQLDRFLLKIEIRYPSSAEEVAVVVRATEGQAGDARSSAGGHGAAAGRRAGRRLRGPAGARHA